MGPLHRVTQCLVALQTPPRSDEEPEPIIEMITHFTGGHRRHPRSRQLDRQWNPVQALADLHHCIRLIGHREARSDGTGSFDEQIDRRRIGPRDDIQ